MPKQIFKIENFHGGLNTDSDPRDIADNELSDLSGFHVDEVGKVRMMGGLADHDAPDPTNHTLRAGYGLFYFSHDRKGAHVIGDNLTGQHDSGGSSNTVLTDGDHSWPVNGLAGATINNTTDGSSGTVQSNTDDDALVDDLLGGVGDTFDNNDYYTITDFPETGDDYLITVDCDATAAALVYSRTNDLWSAGNYPIAMGTTASHSLEPTFYAVDGSVRISDGNYGSGNVNKWYGYINRTLFPNVTPSYSISQWYQKEQKVDAPKPSTWDEGITFASPVNTTHTDTGSGTTDVAVDSLRTALATANVDNIIKSVVSWTYTVTDDDTLVLMNIKCGTHTGAAWVTYETDYAVASVKAAGTYTGTTTFNFAIADTGTGSTWGGTAGDNKFQAEIITYTGTATRGILSNVIYELGSLPNVSAQIGTDNVHVHFDWESTTGASGWNNAGNTGEWKVGASFIYDGVQESQIATLTNVDDNVTETFVVPGSLGVTAAPSIRLFIADFEGLTTKYNKRITGVNLYMQDVSQDTTQPWFLQLSGNFETGKMIVESTQKPYDVLYYAEPNEKYYYWEIGDGSTGSSGSQILEPSLVTSYEISSGLKEEEESILSKYKTAVVVGRRVYIGGLEVEYTDSSKGTEVKGDAMIKSPVNKFDVFPLSRIIEASVADGDSIIKLEEYADRILQFKRHKMHLINVSQEVEFIEDTFMHKGVTTPAAVCKTDFGVAWVNKHGCYFYDGNRVNNLLEKGGKRLISDDDWDDFITEKDESDADPGGSMIGYIPKKRQLIVLRDSFQNTNSGDIYLYDMVTQSWTFGNSKFVGSGGAEERRTNFVNDWNGDLVHLNDEDDGSVFKWDDAADGDASAILTTKDIDFGQPGVRKKIYKVYLTFKGNGTHAQVHYGVDGLAPASTFYPITGATDGSSTGTGATAKCIAYSTGTTDWLKAELKPGAAINNVSSFRLKISGDGTNAIASDFEINDISIVYRLKGVK